MRHERTLRWAYAGHPPALSLDHGEELAPGRQGTPLGIRADPGCEEGARRMAAGDGVLLYTDGLTEARHGKQFFGLDRVTATLAKLRHRGPSDVVGILTAEVAEFAGERLRDDLWVLAARFE